MLEKFNKIKKWIVLVQLLQSKRIGNKMSFRKFYDGHEQLNEETPYDRKQRAMIVNLSQAYRMFISGMRDNNKTRMNNAKKEQK